MSNWFIAVINKLFRSSVRLSLYTDVSGEWRGRLTHRNRNILWVSSESYKNREDLVQATANMVADLAQGVAHTLETYKDEKGEWRSRIKHANGNILWVTAEGYKNRKDMEIMSRNLFTALLDGRYCDDDCCGSECVKDEQDKPKDKPGCCCGH